MKYSSRFILLTLGTAAVTHAMEKREVATIQNAAKAITGDFLDLDRVLNGTALQLRVIEKAYLAAIQDHAALTYAETFEIIGPFQDLRNQVLRTMNTARAKKDEIIASATCDDVKTQLGLVWFFGTAYFANVGKIIPENGQPLWKDMTDPINNAVHDIYMMFYNGCPSKS